MSDNLRIKYLFEYQLKKKNMNYPSFDEYKQQYIQQVEEEEKPLEPISEPASDGSDTIPEPVDNNQTPSQGDDSVVEPPVQQAEPVNQDVPTEEPNNEPVSQNNDDAYKRLEDEMSSQKDAINKILTILQPEPEPSPEEKIIAKIDSLSKEVQDLKNADLEKKERIKNSTPFNISLSKMWNDVEDKEEENLTINQNDIDNYDPNYIKKTLGIPNTIREGYKPYDLEMLKNMDGHKIKAIGKSGVGEGHEVIGTYNYPTEKVPYHSLILDEPSSKNNGLRYEIDIHSIEPLN